MAQGVTTKQQSVDDLLRENEELRRRLEELEETLQRIRQGERDALVSSGLQGADRLCRLLVEKMQEGSAAVAPDGLILFASRQLADMLGVPITRLPGRSLHEFVANGQGDALQKVLTNAQTQKTHSDVDLSNASGSPMHVTISATPVGVDDVRIVSLVIQNRMGEKEKEEEGHLVGDFALGISQADNLEAALESMLHRIHGLTGWQFGEAWLPRLDRRVLESASAWYCESPALESIRAASVEAWLPPGIGFPGRAWIAKQPVWIRDLAHDKGYFGVAAAREAGLHAGVAIPVMAMDHVLAILTFYMRESRTEDETLIRLVANAAADVSAGLQHKISGEESRGHGLLLIEGQRIAHLGNWAWDILADRFTWSVELRHIFGLPEKEPQDMALNFEAYLGMVHSTDRKATRAAFERAIKDRRPFMIVQHVVRPDGEIRVVETRGYVAANSAERPDHIFGVCLDIAEGKRAGEEARERETRIRMLLDQAPVLLWTTDTNLLATSIQGSGLKGDSASSGDVVNDLLPVSEVADTAPGGRVREAHRAALKGEAVTYEIEMSQRVFHCHVEPLRGPDEVITGCIGIALDITDRKVAERNLLTAYNSLETLVEERTAELAAANRGLQSEIVERRRTEDELRKSQERIASILDSITDNYYALDADWRFKEINDHAAEYFGLRREDLIGRSLWEVFSREQYPTLEDQYRRAVERGEPVHFELHSPIVGRWAEIHVYPSPGGLEIYFTDITGRKMAEQALRQSEEHFRDVLENSRDVVFKIDLSTGSYDYVSPASQRVLGLLPHELMDMGFAKMVERIHPDDRPRYQSQFDSLLQGPLEQRSGISQYRWKAKDGSYRWISSSRSVVSDSQGHPLAVIGSLRDITDQRFSEQEIRRANEKLQQEIAERTKAREALESSELRYRAIVEEQTELVSRFRTDGTLTFVNEAFRRFFGRERDDLVGTTFTPVLHPDDIERVQQQIASITPEARSITIENRIVRPDNDIRWVQWTFTGLYDELGGFIEFQTVGRDITERKNAEILLALQYEATRALAESSTVSEANTRALKAICENLGWDLGILWKIDGTAEMLRFEGIWHVPGVESIMVEHSLLPELDLPSRVWKKKKPLWIPGNIEGPERIGTSEGGFKAVFAFPVKIAGTVIAVVECFSRTIMQITPGMLQTLETIGHQIGNYRDRKIAEESVRKAAEELEARVKQRTEQLAGALEALSNSEMRFRAMFEGAPLGIALLSATGTIIERNPTLERMLGYQEGGLYGMSMNALAHPEDLPLYEEQFQSLVNGSQNQYRMELRYLRRDGSVLWGSLSCSSMHFEGSVSPFIITMIKDVTERKEMEEELRVSENRFRTIFEESPIGIALVDRDGRFIQVSHTFVEMIGADARELFTMNINDFAHVEDGPADQQRFRDLVERRRSRYQMEERFHRKDGSMAWANLNAAAIRSGTGEFLYGVRLVEDITLRKETEKRMQMLAHTITSMKESVIITDVNLAIISVNEAFLTTFGYDEREILGRHVSFLRPQGSPKTELTGIFQETLVSGWTGELHASRKNGEVFPMVLSTSVVRGETGRPVALVGIARDVTEQKRLQERLAEAEKRRLADLRRFAISVQRAQEDERQRISRELHDDICQRLSGMKLNMEVLEDDFKSKDKKTFRTLRGFKKQFEQTITEVRRLSSNLRPTVLDDFGLTIALNLLGREFEKAHKIDARVELGNPTVKHLDPQVEIALYRIAQESLTNIAKHANASHVTLRLGLDASSVVLTVRDDGKGFDPKELPHSKRPGHGLGLISMRERAELLGGTWEIHSAPSEGTTIQVTIPVEVSIDHEEN